MNIFEIHLKFLNIEKSNDHKIGNFFFHCVKIPPSWNDEVSSLRVIKGGAQPSLSAHSPASPSGHFSPATAAAAFDLLSTGIV